MERAKSDGVISTFSGGRGYCVWFQGPPGEALRQLKRRVSEALPSYAIALTDESLGLLE